MNLFSTPPTILTSGRLEAALEGYLSVWPRTQITTFGRSLSGRPLYLVKVGEGGPSVLCIATHHAMEWICGYALLSFVSEYYEAEAKKQAPRGTFYLVPLLNPDGVELVANGAREGDVLAPRQRRANRGSEDFSHWQANGRGVDLNHNYPFGFDAYRAVEASLGIWEGAPTRYSGVAPLSEPETQGVASLVDTLSPEITVALHTQGEELYAGNAYGRARILAHLAARHLGYHHATPTGAAAYGGLTDWLISRGMCAMTLECGRGVNPLPSSAYYRIVSQVVPFLFSLPRMWKYVNNL